MRTGRPEDAAIDLDFGALAGGWEADDPVWAGDVDRMFVSLVAPGYDATRTRRSPRRRKAGPS